MVSFIYGIYITVNLENRNSNKLDWKDSSLGMAHAMPYTPSNLDPGLARHMEDAVELGRL